MTDRSCDILVGTRIVRGTTPKPVSDILAEAMTREERKQVLGEVLGELDEEMKLLWEPVLTPMGNLLWINKIEKYSQFMTPRFVYVMPKEPLPDVEPVAASTSVIPVPASTVVKFTTSKPAKACLKKIVDTVLGRLLQGYFTYGLA
eukprot:6137047-Amphidinium_carterae.1